MDGDVLFHSLKKNEDYLKKTIRNGMDIVYRPFIIPAFNNADALLVYINNMADIAEIDESVLKPLMKCTELPELSMFSRKNSKTALLINSGLSVRQARESSTWSEVNDAILQGNAALFIDKCTTAIILTVKKLESRSISEPITESEVRGPRDGFIENIAVNISLIRRRIKDNALTIENLKMGDRTKTDVSLVYMGNIVNDSLLGELKARLNRIKVDSILASSYIEEMIEDHPRSIFPTIEHTERPDKVCAAILEGRIAILVDGTPFALIVPAVFWNFLQTSGDFYERHIMAMFFRWMRFFALILAYTLTSLYVLLATFHQEMLPTNLALKIAAGREGVPFPALIEALIMDILLELMKEAGLRMPGPIGMTVSIVGTYIIGQAAVTAGIVAPLLVVFVTIGAICSYTIPSYSMSNSFRLYRYGLLLLSGTFGVLGFFGGIIGISLYLMSMHSFGVPFLAPVIPYDKESNKDVLNRAPWWKMSRRPGIWHPKDSARQTAAELKPKPPEKRRQKTK